jgi:D-alanyl-D-alanine carboxypeptidase
MTFRLVRLFVLLMVASLIVTSSSVAEAARKKKAAPVDRYASIVIDYQSGVVLSERNANKSLYPASLTKMMTLYMTFSALNDGTLSRNMRLPVSSRAAAQSPSKLGLKAGQTIRVEDAIMGLVTKSANDASVVLAEGIAGSETNFAKRMTSTAKKLGMTRTNFVNASGLHHPRQVSTARDMAALSQALIRDFPRQYRYFSVNSFTYAGIEYNNHNKLMKTYTGMDGIKTGYVYASGFNLAASAVQDGRRLIGVVFGGRTAQSRNKHMAQILDQGFDRLREPRIASRIQQRLALGSAAPRMAVVSNDPASAIQPLLPQRRPESRTQLANIAPSFGIINRTDADTMMEQGDADDSQAETGANAGQLILKPQYNISGNPRRFAVQIGAYASIDAGMAALKQVKQKLPAHIVRNASYKVVPLMTNRGMIYRARLAGLQETHAQDACRRISGNCLILPANE